MKRILLVAIVVAMALPGVALALDGGDAIDDACQMNWVRDHRNGPGVLAMGSPAAVMPQGVQWVALPPAGWTGGLWDIQIGDAYDTPTSGAGMLGCYNCNYQHTMVDWSLMSSYTLDITNNSQQYWFEALLAINTGATGMGDPNTYYETVWVNVAPGATVYLSMNLTGYVNLNHVSNISFKLRSDEPIIDATVYGGPAVVPVEARTWGGIKAQYR